MFPYLMGQLDYIQDPALIALFQEHESIGGVIHFVPVKSVGVPTQEQHANAAISAMKLIDRALEKWSIDRAGDEIPIESFFRLTIDEDKLHGRPIDFAEFWGTDDIAPKQLGDTARLIPNCDGYKTAFFHPPYGLRGADADKDELFRSINARIFGLSPDSCMYHSWSTEWSNYFEAGHEWWGAFFWTVYSPTTNLLTVIGASSTD